MGGPQAEPVGSRSSQDDEGARLPQMILEFNGKAVWKRRTAALCVWKCSSHGMLACLSVIYSREEMKPVCAPRFDGGGERLGWGGCSKRCPSVRSCWM